MIDIDKKNRELAHFAFCAQVAMKFAEQDGKIASFVDEHMFLLRWLVTAQKQKRFPKQVAPEIAWLISRGRQLGWQSRLYERILYLYYSWVDPVNQQPDLHRLTYIIEALKNAGWRYYVLTPDEWKTEKVPARVNGINVLMVEMNHLNDVFCQAGSQLAPLEIRVLGDLQVFGILLLEQKFHVFQVLEKTAYARLFVSIDEKIPEVA
ncbi:hypothetical protein Z042_08800 [Chania multitudinisentens RB-25]|uniref:DUF2913 family protein n=1 Tax=Chania multitudinisentens RB-25 TaxID=1441930 RepID=W0LBR3_9GAMM|nr:DUF2913 family protein [Chania multitudinisentens]AHG19707.1 hypothetical protein Z042_08800 [Chania multitudinisentens RB-25]